MPSNTTTNYMIKECVKCKTAKPLSEFYKNKAMSSGLHNECKSCIKLTSKRSHLKNREQILARQKVYRSNNTDYFNKKGAEWRCRTRYSTKYVRDRLKTDALFRFKNRLRTLLRISIKKQGYTKTSKSYEILGCDHSYFISYIEELFMNGMSWENHGKWHLDHIKPMSLAKSEEECITLNHYTNFQPLWAKDNLRKSNKHSNL